MIPSKNNGIDPAVAQHDAFNRLYELFISDMSGSVPV